MKACFIGHRVIEKTEKLKSSLKEVVKKLINAGCITFLFGSMSEFDNLAWEIVSELKNTYPYIKRVYVRSNNQRIDNFYEEYLFTLYEETYFPTKIEKAGKYSYVERNYEMIDNAKYCVFYYDENYVPKSKVQSKHDRLLKLRRKSGTKIAYKYAVKKKKTIINLFELQKEKN